MLATLAQWLGGVLDASFLYPRTARSRLQRALTQANLRVGVGEWLTLTTLAPLALAALAALLVYAQTREAPLATGSFALAFALALCLLWKHPFAKARARALRMESELPLALRALAVEMGSQTPFERGLAHLSKGYGELSREVRRMLLEVESGSGVTEALKALSERVDSIEVQRTVVQLTLAYEQGGNSEGLRKLAEELSSQQRARAREYQAKLSFIGLLFVAIACIIPALFAAYVIVGSSFLDLAFTPTDVHLAYLLLFPALDALILGYAHRARPVPVGG